MRRSHASVRTVLIGSFTALALALTPGAAAAAPWWPARPPLRGIDPVAMAGHGGTSWRLLGVVALVALAAVAMVALVMAAAGIRGHRGR